MYHQTKMYHTKLLGILVALALLPGAVRAEPCAEAFDQLYPESAQPRVRHVQGEPDNDITYGLEGELDLTKATGLLDWYRSPSISDEQWLAMTREARKHHLGNLRGGGMVRTSRAPEWLGDTLDSDPGGAEFMTRPTNRLETALAWIRAVEAQLGQDRHGRSRVYWQGNVAFKRTGNFSRRNADGLRGYLKATADFAQLGKLHKGYQLHLRDPGFIPGKNLGHMVLGPMSEQNVAELEQELDAAVNGRNSGRSGHYIQGTYFRTWKYGPDRNGFEVRDPHKDVPVLKRELRRLTHGLERGLAAYARFKDVTMTDEHAHYALLSRPVREMLNRFSYSKRYALPMRPLERDYPRALGLSGAEADRLRERITAARRGYVQTLERLAADRGLNVMEKLNAVRVAMGRFAYETGIYPLLDRHFASLAG
jgi:hypothetical protein